MISKKLLFLLSFLVLSCSFDRHSLFAELPNPAPPWIDCSSSDYTMSESDGSQFWEVEKFGVTLMVVLLVIGGMWRAVPVSLTEAAPGIH